jgi:hypothetical protein
MSTQTTDTAKVRVGGQSPSLPRPTSNAGKIRLRGTSPSLLRTR